MKCNVCTQDKELNQFQTYWHSTQQKMRTRKQCKECYYNLRLKRKDPEKYYQNNPDYHKCNTCNDWKLVKEFYTGGNDKIYSNRCRVCTKEYEHNKRRQELEQSCGSEKIKTTPNQYMDEYQKKCTFNIMELFGYTFDEATGIWTKEGWKEIKDGKPYFPNIDKTKVYKSKQIGVKITQEMIEEILTLRRLGYGYNKIAARLGISDTSVFKYVKRYEGKIN